VATVVNGLVTAVSVGTATITVSAEDGNKTATCAVTVQTSLTTGTLTIAQEDITYGETPSPAIVQTGDGEVSYEYKLRNAGDETYSSTIPKAAGSYTVRGVLAETANYTSATTTADFVIAKATLTVTVADTLKLAGMSNPVFRLVYEGFVYDDDETDLPTLPLARTTATRESTAGTYAISLTGGTSDNYTFDRHNGVMTVVNSDVRLIDIQISTGELTPAFSSDITEYAISLPCDETNVTIGATPSDGGTVMYIPGSSTVILDHPGTKTLTVRSTAADGATMDYVITVIRRYPSNLIRRYWDNVVAVNLKPESNGGYTFTSYQWTFNGEPIPGETGEYLHLPNGSPAGIYSIILTANGETTTVCEGIQMNVVARGLKVYPNPVSFNATVENPLWEEVSRMQLYDMAGHLVKEYPVGSSHITINVNGIPAGVYMLKAGNETVKMVIE
jgi:hypothetical protein